MPDTYRRYEERDVYYEDDEPPRRAPPPRRPPPSRDEEIYYERREERRAHSPSPMPMPRRSAPDVSVREREEVVERESRVPHFMREEPRRSEAGPLVLRQRDIETVERARPRPRSPSPVVKERERIVTMTRARSMSPGPPPPPPPPPEIREREEIRTRVVDHSRERIRSPSRGPALDRVRLGTRFIERPDRSPSPPPVERIRTRVVERERERSPSPRLPPPPPPPEFERSRLRIIEREREREPTPSPSPPPPPSPPPVIRAPTIEREVITHYRDIDHGKCISHSICGFVEKVKTSLLSGSDCQMMSLTNTCSIQEWLWPAHHPRHRHLHRAESRNGKQILTSIPEETRPRLTSQRLDLVPGRVPVRYLASGPGHHRLVATTTMRTRFTLLLVATSSRSTSSTNDGAYQLNRRVRGPILPRPNTRMRRMGSLGGLTLVGNSARPGVGGPRIGPLLTSPRALREFAWTASEGGQRR